MSALRRFWIVLLLLGFGSGPLTLQALQKHGCCCTTEVPKASCHCQEQPDSHSHCGLDCSPQLPTAALQPQPEPPHEQVFAVTLVERLVAVLVTLTPENDSRLSLSAGWILPSSPPLLESHLDLPPPALLLI